MFLVSWVRILLGIVPLQTQRKNGKKGQAKGKKGCGHGTGSGAVSVATALTNAARPNSEFISDDGVEYSDGEYNGLMRTSRLKKQCLVDKSLADRNR